MPALRTERIKGIVSDAIQHDADWILATAEELQAHPELGFKEHKTSDIVAQRLEDCGLLVDRELAVTGLRAQIDTGNSGPTVALLGELDALPLPSHPLADVHTGAAHACGHHAQLVHLLAIARALTSTDLVENLTGKIVFLGVPAEEYVDLDFRRNLADQGRIEFFGGKAQLIVEGVFDQIDMALMVHATGRSEDRALSVRQGMNGLLAKSADYVGRASHAGMAPHLGVNALNAASLALHAIHLQRETFQDSDHVRLHPILTKGGETVNIVPAHARIELYVRAANREALMDAASKVDRALLSGALAVGATAEISDLGGYLPLIPTPQLDDLFIENATKLVGAEDVRRLGAVAGSTDAGDLSHLIPVLHAFHGGCKGINHGDDFIVDNPILAYVQPSIALAWTVIDLLGDGAGQARAILGSFRPELTTDGYLDLMRSLNERTHFSGL